MRHYSCELFSFQQESDLLLLELPPLLPEPLLSEEFESDTIDYRFLDEIVTSYSKYMGSGFWGVRVHLDDSSEVSCSIKATITRDTPDFPEYSISTWYARNKIDEMPDNITGFLYPSFSDSERCQGDMPPLLKGRFKDGKFILDTPVFCLLSHGKEAL